MNAICIRAKKHDGLEWPNFYQWLSVATKVHQVEQFNEHYRNYTSTGQYDFKAELAEVPNVVIIYA